MLDEAREYVGGWVLVLPKQALCLTSSVCAVRSVMIFRLIQLLVSRLQESDASDGSAQMI